MPDPNDPYGDPFNDNDPHQNDDASDGYDLSEPVNDVPPPPPPFQPPPAPMMHGTQPGNVRCQSCQADLTGATLGGHCPHCGAPIVAFGGQAGQSSGKAVTSLVLGIISIPMCLCCGLFGVIMGPLAIYFGNQAKQDIAAGTASPGSAGMAKAGLICGIVGTVLGGLSLIANIASIFMNP
ncbi:hypothetical protein OT109_14515 [Phycisphaeraceae bacterium D3-23]